MFNIRKKIIFSFISCLMILSLLACSSEATPESPDIEAAVQAKVKETLDSIPPTPTLNPAFSQILDYQQFFDEIDQNIVAAKAKYEGQKLSFAGIVRTIYENHVSIDFPLDDNWRGGDKRRYPSIYCSGLDRSDLIKLLPKGKITVQGIAKLSTDYNDSVHLEPCVILSYLAPK